MYHYSILVHWEKSGKGGFYSARAIPQGKGPHGEGTARAKPHSQDPEKTYIVFKYKCTCTTLIWMQYILISIRQNYNFNMLAMIWHGIFCWFLKIYQDLKRFAAQEHRFVFVFIFRCADQFYVPNVQGQSKTGKKSEINRQTFIFWWLNSRKYRSVWYLFSCTKSSNLK